MHDFGLDLNKLINIGPKKNCSILVEGTFGLYDKKDEKVIRMGYDYKDILQKSREIIKYEENEKIWPRDRYNGEKPEFWQLLEFLKNYDLVFHEFMPMPWQQKHRLEFINELYNTYFAHKFDAVINQCLSGTSYGYMFSEFISFKNLHNRLTIKKFPVLCSLVTKDSIQTDSPNQIIEYLFDQFQSNEFTLNVKSEEYRGTRVMLALKDQSILNYIGLTVFENWKVDGKIDFGPLIQYMDEVEKYIQTKYLK